MKFIKEIKQKVTQRYLVEQGKDQHGDCWAACISSITGIPLEDIPDPNAEENKEWSIYWVNMWKFLQERGFNLYCESIPRFKDTQVCIACGKSPRGDFNHAVVWNNGIIHDPHPDNKGIHSIDHFEIIEIMD
jgi:hypothetical protein